MIPFVLLASSGRNPECRRQLIPCICRADFPAQKSLIPLLWGLRMQTHSLVIVSFSLKLGKGCFRNGTLRAYLLSGSIAR